MENQEGRKEEIKKDEERTRVKKGESKQAREKERETLKKKNVGAKTVSLVKTKNNNKKTQTSESKEGLGPSELALRATSPDP